MTTPVYDMPRIMKIWDKLYEKADKEYKSLQIGDSLFAFGYQEIELAYLHVSEDHTSILMAGIGQTIHTPTFYQHFVGYLIDKDYNRLYDAGILLYGEGKFTIENEGKENQYIRLTGKALSDALHTAKANAEKLDAFKKKNLKTLTNQLNMVSLN